MCKDVLTLQMQMIGTCKPRLGTQTNISKKGHVNLNTKYMKCFKIPS